MPNYTILIVDYEPRSVERTRRPLVDAGFKVHLAPDGVAALEAFERLKPDLVLLEAMLPKKNGFEVCQELRQTPAGKITPILITTAVYRGRKYRSQALHVHGASEYIEKPIADDQLVAIVRRFLQSSTKRPARIEEDAAPLSEPAKARPVMPAAATPAASAKAPAVKAPALAMTAPSAPAPVPAASAAKSATADATPAKAGAAVMVANAGSSSAESTTLRAERAVSAVVATPAEQMSALLGSGSAAGGSAVSIATWRAAANAMAGALTEDEISERLDALLPLGPDENVGSSSRADVANDEPEADAFDLEAAADVLAETEPEFDAGSSLHAATMSEPVVPMVPAESTDRAERTDDDVLPAEDRTDADVVRFDARRSKKRGKKSKHKQEPAPQASNSPQAEIAPLPIEPRPTIATAPISTPIASKSAAMEEMPAPRRRSMAIWVWLLVVAAIAVAAYFLFFRSDLRVTEERTPAPVDVAANIPPSSPTTAELPSATPASEELPVDGLPVAEPASTTSTNSLASKSMQDAIKPASDSEATAAPPPSRASPSLPAKKRPSPRASELLKASLAERNVASTSMSPAMRLPESSSVAPIPAPAAMPANQTAPAPSPGAAIAMRTEIKTPQPEVAVEAATNPPPAPAETTPALPVKEGDLVALAAADQPPIAVSRPAPAYPKKARTDGEQGEVSLSLLIDETGRVADLRIVNADTDDFGSAASKAARTWKYKPAMKNGVRIKVWKPERVIFKL